MKSAEEFAKVIDEIYQKNLFVREHLMQAITHYSLEAERRGAERMRAMAASLILEECDCGKLGCKPFGQASAIRALPLSDDEGVSDD